MLASMNEYQYGRSQALLSAQLFRYPGSKFSNGFNQGNKIATELGPGRETRITIRYRKPGSASESSILAVSNNNPYRLWVQFIRAGLG